MKRFLLVSTAVAGLALLSSPASAAVKMDLGGYFRGYGVYADNNEPTGAGSSLYSFEFRRDTELHAGGETTLDNGLTIGAHGELKIANGSDSTDSDEIYAYASGGWGRFNLGIEDGAAYLLQVAAPSADSNIDGLRTYIQALNPITVDSDLNTLTANSGAFGSGLLDYDHADFKHSDRLTYLTPKFNGFQAGASYAPKDGFTSNTGGMAFDQDGMAFHDDSADANSMADYKDLWEISARYDGEYEGFGFAFGAGYSNSDIEATPTTADIDASATQDYYLDDGIQSYNGGLTFSAMGFSLGGIYKQTETSRITDTNVGGAVTPESGNITKKTWVIGAAYDNGPWHAGASYLNSKTELDAIGVAADVSEIDASSREDTKYTVGGGYTFGPGMTFRGSVAWGDFDASFTGATADDDNKFTQLTLGTDVQF